MPSGWVDWLGILAVVIAVVAVALTGLQYRWSKRSFREQRQEQVSVRAVYNPALGDTRPTWVLQVYVVNTGMVPVFVKSVGLGYHTPRHAQQVVIPQRSNGDNPIAPGDERYYALRGDEYDGLEDIATLPRRCVFVDVATPDKTILKLPGDQIQFIHSEYDGNPEGHRVVELDPTRRHGLSSVGSDERVERNNK